MLLRDSLYAETRTRDKYFYLSQSVIVQFRHSEEGRIGDFPSCSLGRFVSQALEMEESVLTSVDDLALAQAMVRVWGLEAALKANDNACTQAFMGNDAAAQKWHRVLNLISTVMKPEPAPARASNAKCSTGRIL